MTDFVPSSKLIFYISGNDFDLDKVTHMIGISPTETRIKDDFPLQSILAGVAKTEWCIDLKEDHCIAISVLFEKMLEKLKDKETVIREACQNFQLSADFVLIIHTQGADRPEMLLPREAISFAAAINAEIAFDLYYYEEEA